MKLENVIGVVRSKIAYYPEAFRSKAKREKFRVAIEEGMKEEHELHHPDWYLRFMGVLILFAAAFLLGNYSHGIYHPMPAGVFCEQVDATLKFGPISIPATTENCYSRVEGPEPLVWHVTSEENVTVVCGPRECLKPCNETSGQCYEQFKALDLLYPGDVAYNFYVTPVYVGAYCDGTPQDCNSRYGIGVSCCAKLSDDIGREIDLCIDNCTEGFHAAHMKDGNVYFGSFIGVSGTCQEAIQKYGGYCA